MPLASDHCELLRCPQRSFQWFCLSWVLSGPRAMMEKTEMAIPSVTPVTSSGKGSPALALAKRKGFTAPHCSHLTVAAGRRPRHFTVARQVLSLCCGTMPWRADFSWVRWCWDKPVTVIHPLCISLNRLQTVGPCSRPQPGVCTLSLCVGGVSQK